MARPPVETTGISAARMVLNFRKVPLTEQQFFELCCDNRDFFLELTAQKELIIMTPVGVKSGWRETVLATELTIWARKDGTGVAFGSATGFALPNGAIRGAGRILGSQRKTSTLHA